MESITVIATGLGASKTGLDLITAFQKRMKEGAVKPADVEDCLRQLNDNLWLAKRALQSADEENQKLRRQIEAGDRQHAIEADLDFVQDGGFSVLKSQRDKGVFNPHCPVCWGQNRQLVPLIQTDPGHYTCAIHKTSHETKAYRDEVRRIEEKNLADQTAFTIVPGPNSWMR